ncbi:MAG: hypothetical protein HOP12_02315 [Candidatus Eisenbacteria bacterium]|uniref:Uncharacterized protein n=1 Tax=Eiseniibacteriota bacterium TaxID=2212470 RepID=A0A849SK96_UNCEI|nr:hypothetical protein [Candidatus Eisenbacteria bacterium]
MTKLSKNRTRLLEAIRDLRVADLEVLTALLASEREPGRHAFGAWGVRRACEALLEQGLLHRLWKFRDPKFRINRGSARQVFLLSGKGAVVLGSPAVRAERWFEYLKDPRKEYVLEHELMIARFHAALLRAQQVRPDLLTLIAWEQGEGTEIKGEGVRIRPDAFFVMRSEAVRLRWNVFLEADTGNERIESRDSKRRTIEKKIRRYGEADAKEVVQRQFEVSRFSVLFMSPRRSDPSALSGRESSILSAIQRHGRINEHALNFYRVVSETAIIEALQNPERLFEEVVTHGNGRAYPIIALPASLKALAGSSSSSIPSQELPPTHEAP